MKYSLTIFMFLMLISYTCAAEISGNIYDYTLEPLNNVVVTIDTNPNQQFIAKTGSYQFNVPEGKYNLKATYSENGKVLYSGEEEITVTGDGNFVFDMILFPDLTDEKALSDDFEIDLSDITEEQNNNLFLFVIAMIILLIIGIVWFWFFYHKKQKKPKQNDDVYAQVLSIIKKQKRVTQKDIRKEVPISEAKISLVISEMEDNGIIKKVKKGRGNIIILK